MSKGKVVAVILSLYLLLLFIVNVADGCCKPHTDDLPAPRPHKGKHGKHGKPSGRPTEKPSGRPTEKPPGKPTEKPSGRSTEKPPGKPTEKPSGRPTEKPTSGPIPSKAEPAPSKPIDPYANVDGKTKAAALAYKKELLKGLTPSAQKDDVNVIMTGLRCANNRGSVYLVISPEHNKLLYTVCYNDDTYSGIYTMHSIQLPGQIQSDKRPGFSPTYRLIGLGIDGWYEKKYLIQEFQKIKKNHDIIQDDKSENYYARNHFAPMGDFFESLFQNKSFKHINAFPASQSVNNGNIKNGEAQIQTMSKEGKPGGLKLDIITGVHGILEKYNKKLYLDLDNKRVEVPLLYYKLIIEPKSKRHVVFLTFLDNKLTMTDLNILENKYKCKSQCDRLKYKFKSPEERISAGPTRCCTVNDLKAIVGSYINEIAPGLDPNNLLENIEKVKTPSASPRGTTPKRETSAPPATTRGRTPSLQATPKRAASEGTQAIPARRPSKTQERPARRPSNAGQRVGQRA